MTEPREAASGLPLSLTCAPDSRFVEAVRALVGRVGATAGETALTDPFAAEVGRIVSWVLAHPEAVSGDVAMRFERDGDRLVGDVRWTGPGAPPPVPDVVSSSGVEVACTPDGADIRCRVSCRCT